MEALLFSVLNQGCEEVIDKKVEFCQKLYHMIFFANWEYLQEMDKDLKELGYSYRYLYLDVTKRRKVQEAAETIWWAGWMAYLFEHLQVPWCDPNKCHRVFYLPEKL